MRNTVNIYYDRYGKSGLVLQLQNDQGHMIVDRVIFGIERSQNLLPSAICELFLLSSDLLLIFPGHTLSLYLCALLSCCLYCNFLPLLILLSASHREQFSLISLLSTTFSSPFCICLALPYAFNSLYFSSHSHHNSSAVFSVH